MDSQRIPAGAVAVAVDGSQHAERATAWAARHAQVAGLPLVLVHAVPVGEVHGAAWSDRPEVERLLADPGGDASQREAAPVLEAASRIARGVAAELETVETAMVGDPRVALVEVSRRAGLLVMGSRGRGVFRSLLLGSVSAGVANHAHCPVAVVRDHDGETAVRRVVVGADGSPGSREVVSHAFRLASLHRVPLLVVHCYWDVVAAVTRAGDRSVRDAEAEGLGAGVAEVVSALEREHPDVRARTVLRQGLVDTVLTTSALKGDVIVVGRHVDRTPAQVLSGSVASAVLERAHATVVVVPEPVNP